MTRRSEPRAWRLQKRVIHRGGAGWPTEIEWCFLDGEDSISLYLNTETHLWTAYTIARPVGLQIPILRALLPPEEVAFAFAAIRRGDFTSEPVRFT